MLYIKRFVNGTLINSGIDFFFLARLIVINANQYGIIDCVIVI